MDADPGLTSPSISTKEHEGSLKLPDVGKVKSLKRGNNGKLVTCVVMTYILPRVYENLKPRHQSEDGRLVGIIHLTMRLLGVTKLSNRENATILRQEFEKKLPGWRICQCPVCGNLPRHFAGSRYHVFGAPVHLSIISVLCFGALGPELFGGSENLQPGPQPLSIPGIPGRQVSPADFLR